MILGGILLFFNVLIYVKSKLMLKKLKRSKEILSKEPRGKDEIEKEIVQAEMNIEDAKITIQEQAMMGARPINGIETIVTVVPKKARMPQEEKVVDKKNQFRQEDSIHDSMDEESNSEKSFSRRSWTFRNDEEERGHPVLEDIEPAKPPTQKPEQATEPVSKWNSITVKY